MVSAAEAQDGSLSKGTLIGGRYRVESEIGEGAMGRVYRVTHETLRLPLALKILHPELAVIPEVRQRIEREARLSAWLDHPSVVQVTDYGVHGGRPYLVMRLVDGEELSARMERGPIPPLEAIEIGEALCEGLAHAHGLGLIHRDLKPDNVVLTARGLRILDFGLARAIASDDPRLTRTGLVCGTPRYMSPEQASGDPIDPRSDIYAVGVLLHEMLRGQPMFDGPNAAAVLRQQIVDNPPSLTLSTDRWVDARKLARVVERALSKDPAQRPPNALALRAELAACRRRRPVRPGTPLLVAAALLGLLSLGVGGAIYLLRDPLVEARTAYATGLLDLAERATRARLRENPRDAAARLLSGHVALAKGEVAAAAKAWTEAVGADPRLIGDEDLHDGVLDALPRLHAGSRQDRARADALVDAVADRAPESGTELLARLAREAPSFRWRRRVYEGLERLGAASAIDAFAFLSTELEANRTERCDVRRWYLERLERLNEPRADEIIARERARKRGGCLSDL